MSYVHITEPPTHEECSKCGATIEDTSHSSNIWKLMQRDHICFSCAFWTEIAEEPKDWRRICCDNGGTRDVYYISEENPDIPFSWRGFGGSEFVIRLQGHEDVIVTHNLYHSGDVPKHFYEKFPVNAEFVRGQRWEKRGEQWYLLTPNQSKHLDTTMDLLSGLEEVLGPENK